jgi:hypothetical protein
MGSSWTFGSQGTANCSIAIAPFGAKSDVRYTETGTSAWYRLPASSVPSGPYCPDEYWPATTEGQSTTSPDKFTRPQCRSDGGSVR